MPHEDGCVDFWRTYANDPNRARYLVVKGGTTASIMKTNVCPGSEGNCCVRINLSALQIT